MTHGSHRLFSVDALKGFAISCVVLGHVLLRNVADPTDNNVYLLLSAFEMPLFMFLSGYILPGRVRGSRPAWVWRRAVRLLVPFFAWHAVFFLSRRVMDLGGQDPVMLVQGLARYLVTTISAPTAGLWYLPALVLCSSVLALYYPLAEKPLLLLAAGWVTLGVLAWGRSAAGFEADLGLLKTVTYWPFFAAGFAWGQWKRSLQPGRPLARWLPALLYPLIAVPVMRAMPDMGEVANGASKIALGLAGTAASAVLVEVAEPVARRLRLDELGRLTLGVYCAQWLFLRVEFGSSVLGLAAAFVFTLAGSIAVTWVIGRIPVVKGIFLGEWPKPTARPAA